ncbi:TPA: hypothetical protein ACH3X2_008626 [Trebouxia sp. C0005]
MRLSSSLVRTLQEVPQILLALTQRDLRTLQASCTQLRMLVHAFATRLEIQEDLDGRIPLADIKLLVKGGWFHLQTLRLVKAGLDEAELLQFGQGRWLALSNLDLSQNRISSHAMACVVSCGLPALKAINLSWNSIGACIPLLTLCRWPQLESLNLSRNQVDGAGIQQLVKGDWPLLTSLDLSSNSIPTSAVGALRNTNWSLLEKLDLQGCCHRGADCMPGDDESQARLQAFEDLSQCRWRNLHYLNLARCNLNNLCMQRLCQGQWPELCHLDVTANSLTENSLEHLVDSQWLQLQHLKFTICRVDTVGISYLVRARWPLLTSLGLSGNAIGAEALNILIQGRWPLLTDIDLSNNDLGSGPVLTLANGQQLPLQQGRNVITPPAWLLTSWPRLKVINLSYCAH